VPLLVKVGKSSKSFKQDTRRTTVANFVLRKRPINPIQHELQHTQTPRTNPSAKMNTKATCMSEIPETFICPLTLDIMVDPLMNRHGRSYERSAIVEWITTKNPTCPITRQPMKVTDLVPNNRLRKEILEWRRNQGDDTTVDTQHDDTTSVEEEVIRALTALSFNSDFVRTVRPRRTGRILRFIGIRL
jgi:U-box domain